MRVYQNQDVPLIRSPFFIPWGTRWSVQDSEYHKCNLVFEIVTPKDPRRRPLLRNLRLVNCAASGTISGALMEEIFVDGLKTGKGLGMVGCVFKHVTLRGKLGPIAEGATIDVFDKGAPVNRAFREANAAYSATVDWALDIREAEFREVEFRSAPGHLIRRDPATQVLVTREKAREGAWRDLDLSDTYWPIILNHFLWDSEPASIVLAAPKRDRNFQTLLDGLQKLRDAGVAEPD